MQTCNECGKQRETFRTADKRRLCAACVMRQMSASVTVTYCSRCGGAHTSAQCDVPEGFRQWKEARPD
jgi:NMD protein affecting ribosome stability and mRNA decay